MTTILLSGAISMIVALLGTKPVITVLRRRKLGQQVRTGENMPAHMERNGTPSMGGIVIIIASLIGYVVGHLLTGDPMTVSGILVLFLMTGLGFVGFVDDFLKLFMRRSLGLRSGAKLLGQILVGGSSPYWRSTFPTATISPRRRSTSRSMPTSVSPSARCCSSSGSCSW